MRKTKYKLKSILRFLLITGIMMISLLFAGCAQKPEKENLTIGGDIQKIAEQVIVSNNVTNFSLESINKTKFQLDAISKFILTEYFPNLPNYINNTVWEAKFRGEIEEREYVVIINPINKEIICAFGTDRRAAPGIRPLKIK